MRTKLLAAVSAASASSAAPQAMGVDDDVDDERVSVTANMTAREHRGRDVETTKRFVSSGIDMGIS